MESSQQSRDTVSYLGYPRSFTRYFHSLRDDSFEEREGNVAHAETRRVLRMLFHGGAKDWKGGVARGWKRSAEKFEKEELRSMIFPIVRFRRI